MGDLNLAHNLCLINTGTHLNLLLIPRKIVNFPDPSHTQVAATEALGWWIIPRQEEYDAFAEASAAHFMATVAAWGENTPSMFEGVLDKIGWQLASPVVGKSDPWNQTSTLGLSTVLGDVRIPAAILILVLVCFLGSCYRRVCKWLRETK